MNKKILGILILGIFLMPLIGAHVAVQAKAPDSQQAQPGDNSAAMYFVGQGKVGLFHHNLTLDKTKQLIVETYGGRFNETQEPAGEGTMARIINAYLDGAPDHAPSLKITLDQDGKIYRIEALSPRFKTAKGLHAGSSWTEVRSAYPEAKINVESILMFSAPDDVTCRLSTKAQPDWQKINEGQEAPPEDLKIIGLFTFSR